MRHFSVLFLVGVIGCATEPAAPVAPVVIEAPAPAPVVIHTPAPAPAPAPVKDDPAFSVKVGDNGGSLSGGGVSIDVKPGATQIEIEAAKKKAAAQK